MAGLLAAVFMVAMTPWRAFVLFKIWFWFLVPVWPVLAVPKWNLYGIALVIGWITASPKRDKDKTEKDDWIYYSALSFASPALMLLVAYVIKAVCL